MASKTRAPLFAHGDTVYHRMDQEKLGGLISCIKDYGNHYSYEVDWGTAEGHIEHQENALTNKFTPKFGD